VSEMRYELFLGGEWRGALSGETFEVTNPATGEMVASLSDGGRADMQRAIEAACDAQREWGRTTAGERAAILSEAARLMRGRAGPLARIMTLEQGKPLVQSEGEVMYAASCLDRFAEEARRICGETMPADSPDKRIFLLKRPVGVTAAVTPWNFPTSTVALKVGAALAAGCTMVVKPSELAPLSALELARAFEEAGLPKGVLSVVTGMDPADLSSAILEDRRVRKLSFTGSTEVGKTLMRGASDTVKRLSLELGGHAPFIVFEDADLDDAVENVIASKMRNAGQTCISANRIFVHREITGEFSRRLVERMEEMKVGDGLEDGVEVGPLIEPSAVEKVERHVEDARRKGATLMLGGKRIKGSGNFYEPTVLLGADDSMLVAHEETFGPVAALLPFDDEDEVIARANDTNYGLAAYYFTRDVGRVWRLAEELEYGILGANDGMPATDQTPSGGLKESGFGREGGRYGVEEYLDVKCVSLGGISRRTGGKDGVSHDLSK
jgi:succinate-semialdehyde dehydrogenase/glutarate-semialdehyde dehydrogenase